LDLVVLLLSKILIIVSVVGLLRCSGQFRLMSRELDDQAFAALKRIVHASEEHGYPAHLVPLLMLLTAVFFVIASQITAAGGR
jgi:hypothetical protein